MMACEVYVFIPNSEKSYGFFSLNVNILERNCGLLVLERRNEGAGLPIFGEEASAFNSDLGSGIDVPCRLAIADVLSCPQGSAILARSASPDRAKLLCALCDSVVIFVKIFTALPHTVPLSWPCQVSHPLTGGNP
jgi:hypothetical protein